MEMLIFQFKADNILKSFHILNKLPVSKGDKILSRRPCKAGEVFFSISK